MRKKFTLIELLVVIAIIAILAAMLLPALNKARESARQSTCVNNLKQLGSCVNLYLDDYRGFYPCWGKAPGGLPNWSAQVVTLYLFGNNKESARTSYNADKNAIARCPVREMTNAEFVTAKFTGTSTDNDFWGMYGLNYRYFGDSASGGSTKAVKVPAIRRASSKIYAIDATANTSGEIANRTGTSLPLGRHSGKANVLWADYHVSGHAAAQFISTDSAIDGIYWNPKSL